MIDGSKVCLAFVPVTLIVYLSLIELRKSAMTYVVGKGPRAIASNPVVAALRIHAPQTTMLKSQSLGICWTSAGFTWN